MTQYLCTFSDFPFSLLHSLCSQNTKPLRTICSYQAAALNGCPDNNDMTESLERISPKEAFRLVQSRVAPPNAPLCSALHVMFPGKTSLQRIRFIIQRPSYIGASTHIRDCQAVCGPPPTAGYRSSALDSPVQPNLSAARLPQELVQ